MAGPGSIPGIVERAVFWNDLQLMKVLQVSPFLLRALAMIFGSGFIGLASARAGEILVKQDAGDSKAPNQVTTLSEAIARTRVTGVDKVIRLSGPQVHEIDFPIVLDGRDSGLVLKAEPGAVLSGGVRVQDWKVGPDGVWTAACPVEGRPRELIIHGRRAKRARFPDEGWLRIEQSLPDRRSGFVWQSGDLPQGLQPDGDLELVFLHDWSISRIPVETLDPASRILKTSHPIGSAAPHYAIDHFEKQPRYALEGSVQLMDQPGEWAWSRGTIHYRPKPGEEPSNTVGIVPRLSSLLQVGPGEDGTSPKDIRFEGVTFSHARWDLPVEGYVSGQATMHDWRDGTGRGGRTFMPAAVRVQGSTGVVFEGCTFSHLGGSGLWLGEATRDTRVVQCDFQDISGNGINIGEQGTDRVAGGIAVLNSRLRECGVQFHGAVGIWIGMAEHCRVEGCEISQLPYTGISVGWRWNPTPSPCQGHQVIGNHIHHVMQVLSDGGGIYTLGRQPGTVLARNRIHDVPLNAGRAQSNGIFMDEGTTDLVVADNIIHGIAKSPIRFHKAGHNVIRRNLLGLSPEVPAFTFNNTDSKQIEFVENREVDENEPESRKLFQP